jgi:serine/threonine protein kinase
MHRGGKYIASGTYGCTFNPHLKCINVSNKKNTVGKVFADNNEHDAEVDVMTQIQKDIDPLNKFTVPFYGSCGVHYYRQTDATTKCTHLHQTNPQQHQQLLYGYGGQSLSSKFAKAGSIKSFLNLLPKFLPLFDGLTVFNQYKIVHLDLKTDNILYNRSKLFLIDFGLMQRETDIYSSSNMRVLIHDYVWYPPEFKVYLFKKSGGFDKLFQRVSDNFQGSNKDIANAMTTVLKMNLKHDLEVFFKDDVPKKNYKTYASKIDVYALGILLLKLYLWSGFHKKTYKRPTPKTIVKERLTTLLKGMLHFDPRKRHTPQEALEQFRQLCVNL